MKQREADALYRRRLLQEYLRRMDAQRNCSGRFATVAAGEYRRLRFTSRLKALHWWLAPVRISARG